MNNMKNNKVKICAAIISVGYIIALWSKTGIISDYKDNPLEFIVPMVIIFFAIIISRKVLHKKK